MSNGSAVSRDNQLPYQTLAGALGPLLDIVRLPQRAAPKSKNGKAMITLPMRIEEARGSRTAISVCISSPSSRRKDPPFERAS